MVFSTNFKNYLSSLQAAILNGNSGGSVNSIFGKLLIRGLKKCTSNVEKKNNRIPKHLLTNHHTVVFLISSIKKRSNVSRKKENSLRK